MAEHQAFPYQPIDESPAWLLVGQPKQRRLHAQQSSLIRSIRFAWEGIVYSFQTQRNFRIHCAAGATAMAAACLLRLPVQQVMLVFVLALLVLCAELMNTAIESTLDLHVGDTFDPTVKHIKDIAAGSVLVVSLGALVLGASVFLPAILQRFPR